MSMNAPKIRSDIKLEVGRWLRSCVDTEYNMKIANIDFSNYAGYEWEGIDYEDDDSCREHMVTAERITARFPGMKISFVI